ncbi:MAG: putative DNA binding domain-containing protein [Oligoflexia bacterium]|nr:putative DNA binding domain-containing protein [Oligoflexia bacterium]
MKYPNEESGTLEFKRIIPENDQIIKTMIGFCNQNGGKLIIGVDSDGTIVGVADSQLQKMMEYIHKSIFEASCPPIIPLIYSQNFNDKMLIIIEVSFGTNKPYYKRSEGLEKGSYLRLGRSTIRASADMIEELKWQSRGRSFDSMPVYHSKEDDLDKQKVIDFLIHKKSSLSKRKTLPQELLSSYHLIEIEHVRTYVSTGGILLFGKRPQYFFPEAMIICSHFKGISGREAIASLDCTGTLFEQFETAYNFLLRRLDHSFSIRGSKREEKLEIPEEALREVVLNAIVHRNYHINAPTKIAIYDNRVEIFSPGTFPGPLNTNNLRMGITYIRNGVLCKIFREAKLIEKLGTGFITLFESYERRKLPSPQVIEGENFIKCILPRKTNSPSSSTQNFDNKDKDELSDSEQILHLLERTKEISISDVISSLHLSRATAGRRLTELTSKGTLKKFGKGKATRYRHRILA